MNTCVDPDQHLLQSGPADFETWIDWIHRITKEKSHETIDQLWRWLYQAYSLLTKQPMDSYTLQWHWKYDMSIFANERQLVQMGLLMLFSAFTGSRPGTLLADNNSSK
jgi:hypothetical protein